MISYATIYSFRVVSTKPGQDQTLATRRTGRCPRAVASAGDGRTRSGSAMIAEAAFAIADRRKGALMISAAEWRDN